MKKIFLISVVVSILLTACCGPRNNTPATFPSLTSEPVTTATAPPISTKTLNPAWIELTELPEDHSEICVYCRKTSVSTRIGPTLTPTFTPFPSYPDKKVLFDYYILGNQSDWDIFFDPPSGNIDTKLVLYDDGQMLVTAGETYKQKVLTSDEIKSFLAKLETSGFYTLESNQKHDPTDVLYDFADKYEEVRVYDGLKNCILVNADKSRNLCVHDSYRQFLIPEMKGLLQYLNDYKPAGLTPYYPDRILLSISTTDPSNEALPATATPWNENFPSLEFSRPGKFFDDISTATIYIDGEMAKEVYIFINNSETGGMFTQNGKEYLVFIRVLLPHEKVINTYQ